MAVKWPGQAKFILDGTQRYTRYIPADNALRGQSADPLCQSASSPLHSAILLPVAAHYVSRANGSKRSCWKRHDFDIRKMKAMQLNNEFVSLPEALPALMSMTGPVERSTAACPTTAGWDRACSLDDESYATNCGWNNVAVHLCWDEFQELHIFSLRAPG